MLWQKNSANGLAAPLNVNQKPAMHPEDIRKIYESVPFEPFSVVLADGRAFRVPHPDFLSLGPKGRMICWWDEDGTIGGWLATALVAEIRMRGNGTGRPKRRRR